MSSPHAHDTGPPDRRDREAPGLDRPGAACPRAPTYYNIQALRGIAIILVVLLHLANAEYLNGGRGRVLSAFSIFGISGVDLFFVISGFVMATITRGTFRKKSSLPLFLYSRAARIYPPYWVFSIALLVGHLQFPLLGDPQRWREIDVTRSLLLLPQEHLPILVVGWTLVLELYFYLVVALSLLLPERFFVRVLLIWAGVVVAANLVFPGAALLVLYPQTLEFIFGCLIARFVHAGHRRWGAALFVVGAILLATLYAAYAGLRPAHLPSAWERLVLFGFPSTLMVYGACSMELSHAARLPRFLAIVGDRSYALYLTHVPVILAVDLLYNRIDTSGYTSPLAAVLFKAVAVSAAGFGGYVAIELPLHRAMRRIRDRWQSRFCAAESV